MPITAKARTAADEFWGKIGLPLDPGSMLSKHMTDFEASIRSEYEGWIPPSQQETPPDDYDPSANLRDPASDAPLGPPEEPAP